MQLKIGFIGFIGFIGIIGIIGIIGNFYTPLFNPIARDFKINPFMTAVHLDG